MKKNLGSKVTVGINLFYVRIYAKNVDSEKVVGWSANLRGLIVVSPVTSGDKYVKILRCFVRKSEYCSWDRLCEVK